MPPSGASPPTPSGRESLGELDERPLGHSTPDLNALSQPPCGLVGIGATGSPPLNLPRQAARIVKFPHPAAHRRPVSARPGDPCPRVHGLPRHPLHPRP